MHELPVASWILIAFSTVPWLVATLVYYVRNSRRDPASATQNDQS
jgi:hypothetical protein